MIRRLGAWCDRIAHEYVPDPFIFAALLTFLTLILGVVLAGQTPLAMIGHWGRGLWELLEFGMQMALVLVTGHALAASPPVRRTIAALAGRPRTARQAVALVAFGACASSLVNWGLGLIAGALLAREVGRQAARRGIAVHYPLLAAAGYTGLMVWHGGLSGSAPLTVATPGHFLEKTIGQIPISSTLFSPVNLVVSLGLLAIVPALCCAMSPRRDSEMIPPPAQPPEDPAGESRPPGEDRPPRPGARRTIAERLDESAFIAAALALMGIGYCLYQLRAESIRAGSFNLTLNIVNLFMLSLGLLLHRSPSSYLRAVGDGAKGTAGIILQFPFYAGIMGMMRYSGLVAIFSSWFVAVSGPRTFPVLAFLSAGIVNLFVPSGGGQWAVQGPILVDAAQKMGASLPKTILALAYGDEWTNMAQPFWALALLGIVGLRARDIIGYSTAVMLLSGAWYALALYLVPG
jgi:short-chain fatty acids transporter